MLREVRDELRVVLARLVSFVGLATAIGKVGCIVSWRACCLLPGLYTSRGAAIVGIPSRLSLLISECLCVVVKLEKIICLPLRLTVRLGLCQKSFFRPLLGLLLGLLLLLAFVHAPLGSGIFFLVRLSEFLMLPTSCVSEF